MTRRPAALLSALLGACAGRRAAPVAPEDRIFAPDQVELAPQLIGCSGYSPPNDVALANARIEFQFVVDRNGAIAPTSAVARSTRQRSNNPARQRPDDALVMEARQALLTCSYQPARHAGTTVAVRMRRTLLFTR
jgi:hypothetical protein